VDNTMVVRTDDNDIGRVIVLRTGKIVYMMCLNNAVAIFIADFLTTYLVAIVIKLFNPYC